MNIVTREGLIESDGQVYRWRYDLQSAYFSLSSLNENRIIVKIVSLEDFTNIGVRKLVEQELTILGILHNTAKKYDAPMVTFNKVDGAALKENSPVKIDSLPVEILKNNLRKALKVEDYEHAILYRNELIRRNIL